MAPITRLMTPVFRVGKLMLDQTSLIGSAHGLSYAELKLLATLRRAPAPHERTPGELACHTLLSSGGLSKVLNALQKKRLVVRPSGGSDKRSKPVRLSARGRALADRVMAEVIRADDTLLLSQITREDLHCLTRIMRRLLDALEPRGGMRGAALTACDGREATATRRLIHNETANDVEF